MQVKQGDFYEIKRIVAYDNLLIYTDFNETFKMHTDTRKFQLGAVISKKTNLSLSTVETLLMPNNTIQ